MFMELAGMLEALGANFTLERSFLSVSSQMIHECPQFLEALGANLTIERPFPSVNTNNMSLQGTGLLEALQANFAVEMSLISVNTNMSLQSTIEIEAL